MWAKIKQIFSAKPEFDYSQFLAFRRDFEALQDEIYDLKERFNRFQNRHLMRSARDNRGGVDQDLIDQAREIAGKNEQQGPSLVPGTFRRKT